MLFSRGCGGSGCAQPGVQRTRLRRGATSAVLGRRRVANGGHGRHRRAADAIVRQQARMHADREQSDEAETPNALFIPFSSICDRLCRKWFWSHHVFLLYSGDTDYLAACIFRACVDVYPRAWCDSAPHCGRHRDRRSQSFPDPRFVFSRFVGKDRDLRPFVGFV